MTTLQWGDATRWLCLLPVVVGTGILTQVTALTGALLLRSFHQIEFAFWLQKMMFAVILPLSLVATSIVIAPKARAAIATLETFLLVVAAVVLSLLFAPDAARWFSAWNVALTGIGALGGAMIGLTLCSDLSQRLGPK
jgi:hypothetical protein